MGTLGATTNTEPRTAPHESAQEQTGAHLRELELVLGRIDSGRTYYQILGIVRTDSHEEIILSYQRLIDLLYPSGSSAGTLPADLVSRIERSFAKASQAFGVLASFSRRKEYDEALLSTTLKPARQPATRTQNTVTTAEAVDAARQRPVVPQASAVTSGSAPPPTRSQWGSGQVFRETSPGSSSDNRRRCGRINLSIPVRVTGYDQSKGKWHEMTETIDVSRTGAKLRLRQRVKHGTVLFLTLPMPTKLRAHGFAEQSYHVYALIRAVDPPKNGVRAVGVEFLGDHPPPGFIEKPWAIYRAKRKGANDRRRHRREERAEAFMIQYLDEQGQTIAREEARSENIGRRGLRVVGTTAPAEFDLVALNCARLNFDAAATLRDRFRGKDGLERLCFQFIDKEWPA